MGGRGGHLRMFLLVEDHDPFLAERVPRGRRRGTGQRALIDFRIAPDDHRGAAGEIAVIWSDLSVPVLQFNVYLTGYDMYHLNLQALLIGGVQPQAHC
jgi:hypothetical protein